MLSQSPNNTAILDREECAAFDGRLRDICNGTADLPMSRINAYRTRWGLTELEDDGRTVQMLTLGSAVRSAPSSAARQPQPCRSCGGAKPQSAPGVGSFLVAIYERAGVPSCQACKDLAAKMDDWGPAGCRARIDEIVADILPRAKDWMKHNAPWVHSLLPGIVEDFGLKLKITSDVNSAIDQAEAAQSSRHSRGHKTRLSSNRADKLAVATARRQADGNKPAPEAVLEFRRAQCSTCPQSSCRHKLQPENLTIRAEECPSGRWLPQNDSYRPLINPTRHMIFHIYPLLGAEWNWHWHIENIRQVAPFFNGKIVIGIVTGPNLEKPDVVQSLFDGIPVTEWIIRENVKVLGETVTFTDLLHAVETTDPNAITFRGHTKGVTHRIGDFYQQWAELLWETCLDLPSVEDALASHLFAGPMKSHEPLVGNQRFQWFFAGSFFWFRNADIFTRKWTASEPVRWWSEAFPGAMASNHESACLCHDFTNGATFNQHYFKTEALKDFTLWNEARPGRQRRLTGQRLNIPSTISHPVRQLPRMNVFSQRNRATGPPLIGIPIDRSRLVSHILYHVMPLAGASEWIWRRQVEWLRQIRPQFNGRLIVGIVTKSPTDQWEYVTTEKVQAAFDGLDAEFIVVQNDDGSGPRRGRGEGLTFLSMLEKIQTNDPNEVFFYGHSKGVTHPDQRLGEPVHLWTEALFEASFRNREAMIDALDRYGIAGSFRVAKSAKRNALHGWHYSGTFWACRSADVFRREWMNLKSFYGCVEMWVNGMFQEQEAACLLLDAIPDSSRLYSREFWDTTGLPAWYEWRKIRAAGIPSVTLATVVFNPSAACIDNLNRIFADAKRGLGATTQSVVIDNSPQPTSGISADVYHWNAGRNNQWGGAINQAVQLATGDYFIHFSATRTRVHDSRWMKAILAPLSDPQCGMAGPVQPVPYAWINEPNPRPGEPEMHVQQAICAARTEVLRRFPWGDKFPHCYSDVWQSFTMVKGGLNLVNVPEVTSAAGLEKCKPGAMLSCVSEKL